MALPAAAQFTITTNFVPNATIGEPYPAVVMETTGGLGPISWSFIASQHPPVSQNPPFGFFAGPSATGTVTTGTFCWGVLRIDGVPECGGNVSASFGNYIFVVRAQDAEGKVATRQFQFLLEDPLRIGTTLLPDVTVNQPYQVQLTANGGTGSYQWTIFSGFLPPGITLATNGLLAGTAPPTGGTYDFVLRVTDLILGTSVIQPFRLTVQGGLRIITPALPLLPRGEPVNFKLDAEGGSPNLLWTVAPGWQLPTGLSLSEAGRLIGAGSVLGAYTVRIQVQDLTAGVLDERQYDIFITAGELDIQQNQLPVAAINAPYSTQLTPVGGLGPFRWSFATGQTQGLTININTGAITGTPPTQGIFDLPVALTDATGTRVDRRFRLHVAGTVSITTSSFPVATVGTPFEDRLQVAGGQAPYRWRVLTGTLPPGLELDPIIGRIFGTPASNGAFTFTLEVTDFGARVGTRELAIVVGQPIAITSTALPDGIANQAYSFAIQSSGGAPPLTWRIVGVSGNIDPNAFSIQPASGVFGGASPPATGTFRIEVTDAAGKSAQREFNLSIFPTLTITSAVQGGGQGVPYSAMLAATGGRTPYQWSIASGALPPGVSLNSNGTVSGTPTSTGAFSAEIQAADAGAQTARSNLTININPALAITTGEVDAPYNESFSRLLGAGGGFPPYTWSIASGSLPAGLTLNAAAGTISGSSASAGPTTFTLQVRDRELQTATRAVTIRIGLPPLPTVSVNAPSGAGSGDQIGFGLTLNDPLLAAIDGTFNLSFVSAVGGDDAMIRFANGMRSASFQIPAGSLESSRVTLLTGTVAGNIDITANNLQAGGTNVTPNPAPTARITIARAAPVITSATVTRSGSTANVVLTGYTNTREMADGTFRFTVNQNGTQSTVTVDVPLSAAFAAWFQNGASNATGGQFRLAIPFNLDANVSLVSTSVTLRNTAGTSAQTTF